MAHLVSKRSAQGWKVFALIGLPVLLLIGAVLYLLRRRPATIIKRVLTKYSLSQSTINYWIAVSAFETAGWTSQVYRDSNNLFNLIVPGSNKLQYGEGQTIYPDPESSAIALWTEVIKPFKYSLNYPSLRSLTDDMATKQYYVSDPLIYYQGCLTWYNRLNLGPQV